MRKLTIVCVIGTRPEALKMIPLIKTLQSDEKFRIETVVTGQHKELLEPILQEFHINSAINFSVMSPNQNLNTLSAKLLSHFDRFFSENPCDLVIAQGDTNTTFMAGLSAFYRKIPFAHVEAGLRTSTIHFPFPEELNRRTISMLANLHFCPTQQSADNLLKEGIHTNVFITGNTIIDTLHHYVKKVNVKKLTDEKIILVTCHRRENFGKPLLRITAALRLLVERNPAIKVMFLMHPNRNVQTIVEKQLVCIPNIILSPALNYEQLVQVMLNAYLILTDSGGLQEEAPALNKPILVLRNETERTEGIACGAALLIGNDLNTIIYHVERLLTDKNSYQRMSQAKPPYGDGHSARRIADIITKFLTRNEINQANYEIDHSNSLL